MKKYHFLYSATLNENLHKYLVYIQIILIVAGVEKNTNYSYDIATSNMHYAQNMENSYFHSTFVVPVRCKILTFRCLDR